MEIEQGRRSIRLLRLSPEILDGVDSLSSENRFLLDIIRNPVCLCRFHAQDALPISCPKDQDMFLQPPALTPIIIFRHLFPNKVCTNYCSLICLIFS